MSTADTTVNRPPTKPDFIITLEQLQGGVLPGILTRALADTAMAVAEHATPNQKGKITLELTLKRSKGQSQLELVHKIAYSHPTMRGKKAEEAVDHTTVFVNHSGHVSVVPDTQTNLFD